MPTPVQKGDRVALNNFGVTNLGVITDVAPSDHPDFVTVTIEWDDGFVDNGGWAWPSSDLTRVS